MNKYLKMAFAPAKLGNLELRNRIIKSSTFEGMSRGGIPSQQLLEFHRDIAQGGVAMTTLGYCAVDPDGRGNENNLYLHDGIREPLKAIIDAVHATGARMSGQMVHCGNMTKNRKMQRLKRPLGPSPQLNLYGLPHGLPFAGAMSEADIRDFVRRFGESAGFMKSLGFDAVEIHFGHGYGISQFISPKTNRRKDRYGGSLENRMRLPLEVLAAVREAVGDSYPIIGKIGLTDGIKGGLKTDEAVEVAAMLDKGGITALVTSGGSSSHNSMLIFRGESIGKGLAEQESNRLARWGMKMLSPLMFPNYPYKELYFLDRARRVRDRVQCQVIYIGGCSTMESIETVMREGFDFVQMGRSLIKDPEFVNHAAADPDYVNGCTHCNRCVTLIEHPQGVRCVLNDLPPAA